MQRYWLFIYLAVIFFSYFTTLHMLQTTHFIIITYPHAQMQITSQQQHQKIMWSKAMHGGMWVQCRLARQSLQHNEKGDSQNKGNFWDVLMLKCQMKTKHGKRSLNNTF